MNESPLASRRHPATGARRVGRSVLGLFAALVLAVLSSATAFAAPAFAASARHQPAPPSAQLSMGRQSVPATGGALVLTLRTARATRCRLVAPAPVELDRHWRGCRDGLLRMVAHVPESTATRARRWRVLAWVVGPGGRRSVASSITEAGGRRVALLPPPPAPATRPSPPAPSSTQRPVEQSPQLSVATASLPGATVGEAYSASLVATGGTAPYTWSLVGGALPPGLSLSPAGAILGTPGAASTSSFTVEVSDATTPTPEVATAALSLTTSLPPFTGTGTTNWSGYVVPSSAAPFTEASGRWTEPTLDCAATPNAGASMWVGIGGTTWANGLSAGPLLQTGTSASCVGGVQHDSAWWELVPATPNQSFQFTGFPVAPGDVLKASVFQVSSGAWETRLDDLTTGLAAVMVTGEGWGVTNGSGSFVVQGSAQQLSYPGAYSAEWIVEDYEQGDTGLVPLADYGTVAFSDLTTSLPSWSLTPGEATEIVQGGTVLSTPSPPSSDGFSVGYTG